MTETDDETCRKFDEVPDGNKIKNLIDLMRKMKKKKAAMVLMVGLPGAGKTRMALRLHHTGMASYIVSSDAVRFRLLSSVKTGVFYSHVKERMVWDELFREFSEIMLEEEAVVIIDATNLTKGRRADWITRGKGIREDVLVVTVTMLCDARTCKNRQRERMRVVPDDRFQSMVESFTMPTVDEGIDLMIVIKSD